MIDKVETLTVADAIVELCGDAAAQTNGEAIPMDGGGWER